MMPTVAAMIPPGLTVPMIVAVINRLITNRRARYDDARRANRRRDDYPRRANRNRVTNDDRGAGHTNADTDVDSGLGGGHSSRENDCN